MHGITTESICFYLLVWFVAFVAAFARSVRDGNRGGIGHGLALGATSGLFSFGIICFLIDSSTGSDSRGWYYLGLSALFGLLAKEQDGFAKAVISRAFLAAKVMFADSKTEEKEEKDE